MKKLLIFAFLIFVVSSFSVVKPASADMASFLSTVVSQAQNLAPQAYQAQQRGFFVGGSMTIPPQSVSEQLASYTPPSLSMNGCGAINLTMGGFSYMNPQYLMQKLQGIIQMAPSFALEIAIKILSEQAGNTMNFLEHISDLINSTNINSCHAMSTIATSILPTSLSVKAGLEKANATSGQANGGGGWFGGITGATSNAGQALSNWWSETAPPSGQSLVNFENENCPIANGGDSMLDTAAANANFGSIPSNFIDFIRAYVGDVVPVKGSNINNNSGCDMSVTYIAGPEPVQGLLKGLAVSNLSGSNGTLYTISVANLMSGAGATATNFTSLQSQVVNSLQDILNNLQPGVNASSSLTASDVQLINESNIPLYPFLKAAVLTGDPEAAQVILDKISKPVAMNIIFNIVSNYIHQTEVLMDFQKGQLQRGATPGANTAGVTQINKLLSALITMQKYIYQDYLNELNESYKTVGNFTSQYSAIQQEVNAEFKKAGYGRYLTKFAGAAGM
ncbi:MAG: conjugal transfer protein TraH [bacterium]